MLIKFTAKTMPRYAGIDGLGGSIDLAAGATAEVSESVGKLLQRKYGANFKEEAAPEEKAEPVVEIKPEHSPDADKFMRKTIKTKTK